jgi:hypothetical protein
MPLKNKQFRRFAPSALLVILMWLLPIEFALGSESAPETTGHSERSADWERGGWQLLQKFCIECHNADFQEAELDLMPFVDLRHAEANPELWNRVLQMVRFGAMPPEDSPMPSESERRQLGDAIDQAVFNVTCDLRPRSGRVTARRLNRVEYNHTIRDLFGVEIDVTGDFPSDEVGGGFDNNADVLAMPPMLFEKYLAAAERVASTVLIDPATIKKDSIELSGERIAITGEGYTERFYGRLFPKGSIAWVEFDIANSGKFVIRFWGAATNKSRGEQAIAVYDAEGIPIFAHSFRYLGKEGRGEAKFNHTFAAGTNRLLFTPIAEVPERITDLPSLEIGDRLTEKHLAEGRDQFRQPLRIDPKIDWEAMAFIFRKVSIGGPNELPPDAFPPSQSMILKETPQHRGGKYVGVGSAAKACLEPLLTKAFRGPVDSSMVDRYVGLVVAATERGDSYHRGIQDAITAMLVSPRFLFRVETPAAGTTPDAAGEVRLSDHQLATRLSYFLWSSMPDDELLRLADQQKLGDPQVLETQVERMLRDPRSKSLGEQFASQWLGLRNLEGMPRDERLFPGYNADLVGSMIGETRRLFTHVMRNNLPVGELLDADYTFIDERLARHYGLAWPVTDGHVDEAGTNGTEGGTKVDTADEKNEDQHGGFRRVSLADTPRRGVLNHASILTLTSYPTRTSPVLRGKWILESVLGTPPPDPPANVPELEADHASAEGLSIREQLAIHRDNASCASCHRVMDQLGFGFEDFDAVGRYRGDVDASGELPGGRRFNGGKELAETLRRSEASRFAMTVTEKLLAFALGRELSPADRCVTEQIAEACQAENHQLGDLVNRVVASRPFQYFQIDSGVSNETN